MEKLEKLKFNSFAAGVLTGLALTLIMLIIVIKWIFVIPFILAIFMARIFAKDADKIGKELKDGINTNA